LKLDSEHGEEQEDVNPKLNVNHQSQRLTPITFPLGAVQNGIHSLGSVGIALIQLDKPWRYFFRSTSVLLVIDEARGAAETNRTSNLRLRSQANPRL
jgi:hypothetical protein